MSFVRSEPNRRPSFQPSEPMVRASQSRPARSPSLARVVRNNGDEAAPQSRPADWSWTPAFAGVTRGDIRGRGLREQRIRTTQLEAGIAPLLTALQRAADYLLLHVVRADTAHAPTTNSQIPDDALSFYKPCDADSETVLFTSGTYGRTHWSAPTANTRSD